MLHVFHIDAGRMLTFDIGYAAETVSTLQEALSQHVQAPVTEQVLLISGGEVLDNPERRVSRYSAGTDSNPIFLVCRPTGDLNHSVYASACSPTPDLVNALEVENQISQASQLQPTFQTIQLCVQISKRLVQAADAHVERCAQLVYDQHLLHQGWLAVIANLDDTVAAFRQRFIKFRDKIERFSTQRQHALDLLAAFESDVHLLRQIPLLPGLLSQSDTSQSQPAPIGASLFDWISSKEPEHSLQDLAADARQALDRLVDPRIVENLTALEGATLERAQDVSMKEIGGLGKRLARLDEYLQHVKKLQVEQRQYAESLRVQEQRAATVNDRSIIADLCLNHLSALRKMNDRHKQLADVTRRFCEAKTELLKNIHIRLRWVTETHQLIQTGDSRVMMNGERLHRLRRQLELLKQLHDAPFVYASAVTEVARRKAFSQEFVDWAIRLTEKSKQLCADENRLRDIFSDKFDRHFLRTLFPGMEDRMPDFAGEPPELFDRCLPPIEVEHVRELRYAVPQLNHLLYVQKPNVLERVSLPTVKHQSAPPLQRDFSFFSHTPPKYTTNGPVSGSAPVIIRNSNAGFQSPSWFTGDELEFWPTESRKHEQDGPRPLAVATANISDESDDAGAAKSGGDSDSEAVAGSANISHSPVANGGRSVRSAPIRIPMANRNEDGARGASASVMAMSRGRFSEKGGSSGKFGTPDERMLAGLSTDDRQLADEEVRIVTTSIALEGWRSTEDVADIITNSIQTTTLSAVALFHEDADQQGKIGEEEEAAEEEEDDIGEKSVVVMAEKECQADGDLVAEKECQACGDSKRNAPAVQKQFESRAVQTKPDSTKISILRIAKGDLVLLVFDSQFKTFVILTVSPTLYILKDSCLQRMGCLQGNSTDKTTGGELDTTQQQGSSSADAIFPKQRWILARVLDLDYCQIKKPTNRYKLPMNTRFFRVAAEPVVLKPHP